MVEELKSGNVLVGLRQFLRAAETGVALKAFVAKDCAPHIFKEITDNCNKYGISVEYIETMSELGKICGIDVGAAVAAITK